MKKKKIETITICAIDILSNKKIIKYNIIKYSGITYKTYKFFYLELKEYKPLISFEYSYIPFKWLEIDEDYYITSIHYSKIYKINKKNFNSNKSFKIKDKIYILNKINLRLYVDEDYQQDLQILLNSEEKVLKLLKNQYDLINKLYKNNNWSILTKQNISEAQRKLSKLLNELYIIRFSKYNFNNIPIYFPLFMDFRGRKYYHSEIGPTASRICRLSYYYGYYEKNDMTTNNKYSTKFIADIQLFCKKFNITYDIRIQEHIFWCLIGIGKFFINKNKYPIETEEFIKKGIENFSEDIQEIDIDKQLEILHYVRIIKSLNEDKIKKRSIIKDATASINQIFMKKLGPINQESLNYVNLGNSNKWYDTYIVHREKFYEYYSNKISINKDEFNKCFSRKLIKNTIMIIPYSAGFNLCWENYKKEIIENNLDIIINKDLKKIYELFYNFIKKEIQENFLYQKTSKKLIDEINLNFEEQRKYVLESETGQADISYYKLKKGSVDKKYIYELENKRITRLVLEPTKAIDIENFNISSGANTAHFYDADEVRTLEKELGYNIITVHDSYLIDFANCTKLIDIKIKHYQKYIENYEIKNIFILL